MNNEDAGTVLAGRGLRQGDPPLPYVYIICTEGLSSLIKSATNSGEIHGI